MPFQDAFQNYSLREQTLDGISGSFLAGWKELAANTVEPNPFLEPQFVLAHHHHIEMEPPLTVWSVHDADQIPVAMLIARPVAVSSEIPFPHLNDHFSLYQFQGGMLLHQRAARSGAIALLQYLKSTRFRHGMQLNTVCIDSPFSNHFFVAAALTDFHVQLRNVWSRAVLDLNSLYRTNLFESCLSKSRRKSMRRSFTRLEQRGSVSFRVIEKGAELSPAVSRFLELEQCGWKKETNTAIACLPAHRLFFEEYIESLAVEGRVLFGELLVGDQVIASTCNLIAGSTLFAFKIGWNPDFQDGSPGAWAEIELANFIARERPAINLLNSCSSAGSYLDRLWPHRIAMGNLVLSQSNRAVLYSGVRKSLRFARDLLWPRDEQKSTEILEQAASP